MEIGEFWENSLNGRSCVRPIKNFEVDRGFSRIAAFVDGFPEDSLFGLQGPSREKDRTYRMALYCIERAFESAHISEPEFKTSCGLYISSAIGQMGDMESYFLPAFECNDFTLESFSFGSLTGRLASHFGLRGGHMLIPTGCVGGCDAVSYAADLIRYGLSERVLAGAAEAPITPLVVAAFGRIGANSTRDCAPEEASCPFDKRRDGFVLAEGAAVLLLESETSALARGARIQAEIAGTGSINNCCHMTDISPGGEAIAEACQLALKDAECRPAEIDFISAHGSSTPQNDVAESVALRKTFGNSLDRIPVTSLKSQCGHALSAANAIEIVSTICSIEHSEIPPTINLQEQDPACVVNIVAGRSLRVPVHKALKVSSGFSGIHTAVVLSEYQG